jgi:lactoylglutathione lyase
MKGAGIYETHIETKKLEEAISFYKKLNLELAHIIEDRRVAFFWLSDAARKEQMLGIWEVPQDKFKPSHFAFSVSFEDLMKVPAFLAEKGIDLRPSFGLDTSEPIVHAWMPAPSYYFYDRDGNSLEYITILNSKPRPELGAVHLSTWNTNVL